MRVRVWRGAAVLAAALAMGGTAQAETAGHGGDQAQLREYAQRTWASMAAMTDPSSGLPADILNADGSTSVQTSTTNIGAYMWSAVAARRLGIIGDRELTARLTKTLTTLEHMERFGDTGQYYNWYDHRTGAKLTAWPPAPEQEFHPILSSVDNGWLAVGLRIVQRSVPTLSRRAGALFDAMDFGFYYRPDVNRVLFHYRPDDPAASPCCYDTVVSESRIVDYLGIAKGQLPDKEYYGRWRTFPDTCNYSFQEQKPEGTTRTYFGVPVFEGTYTYNNTKLVPSWGGSMFEALMPDLFVPEERWGPRSWGTNHPATVRAQIFHGMTEAGYGYWGFSPSNTPEGGYAAYGVDAIGMDPNGNPSNEDRTLVDHGFDLPGCAGARPAQPDPPPEAYTNGVVTPHAAFLGLRYAPRETLDDVARLARDFPGMYGPWGFRDSVNVQTGHVSGAYLSLDQGMIMAALGNALGGDVLRDAFAGKAEEQALRPVIGAERFGR
ncbi:MAG TPA: glucoamylase family protein [Baekduia sp.]|nr:glucoamylase family protein [Baekduia sp.]